MNRRSFIRATGLSSLGVLLAPAAWGQARRKRTVIRRQEIESAVKAAFGGGFVVVDYATVDHSHQATIQHLGNCYHVESEDLRRWTIVNSSL